MMLGITTGVGYQSKVKRKSLAWERSEHREARTVKDSTLNIEETYDYDSKLGNTVFITLP